MAVVDLAALPAPEVVETLDYDAILAAMSADLRGRHPEFDAWVESEPALKLLEVAAYRELLLRHRINSAARALLLAFAAGPDLDHLAALYGVTRAADETDARLQQRLQTALSAFSTAGSRDAYIHHALTADPLVREACADRTRPGEVRIILTSHETAEGAASSALLARVRAALGDERVRPLTDTLNVRSADVHPYRITATLTISPGADADAVLAAARASAVAYVHSIQHCGADVYRSAITAALMVGGVTNLALTAPAADVRVRHWEVPWCTAQATRPYVYPTTHPLDGITLSAA